MSSTSPRTNLQASLDAISQLANKTLSGSPPKDVSAGDGQYLELPLQSSRRRPSLDSTYSELSEFSVNSADLRHDRPFLPSAPNSHTQRLTRFSRSPDSPNSLRRRHGIRGYLDAFWLRNKGVVLVLLAMVFGSGMNVSARLMETDGSHGKAMYPFQILFARMSITVLLSLLYGFRTRIPHFPFGHPSVRRLLILRGMGGFFGVFGLYWSLLYLPLAEATVLTFLAPILTCYACSLLIKGESFSRQQQIAGFTSLVGVVFIARPGSLFTSFSHSAAGVGDASGATSPALSSNTSSPSTPHIPTATAPPPTPNQHLHATLLALLGVLGATTAMTTIRKIGTRAHPLISVNYFSSWCTLVSLIAVLAVPSVGFRLPANAQECGLLALLGGFGFVMQFLLTAGLSYGGQPAPVTVYRRTSAAENQTADREILRRDIEEERPEARQPTKQSRRAAAAAATSAATKGSGTRATSMLYTQMLFALGFDRWIWGISPEWQSWVGSVIILGSAVWVAAAREKVNSRGREVEEEEGKGEEEEGGEGEGEQELSLMHSMPRNQSQEMENENEDEREGRR